jgi:hypothetical protein
MQFLWKLECSTSLECQELLPRGDIAGIGTSSMSWMIPVGLNSAILLISCLIGRVFANRDGPDVDILFALATLTQSAIVWGLFGAYRLNEWYWGLSG